MITTPKKSIQKNYHMSSFLSFIAPQHFYLIKMYIETDRLVWINFMEPNSIFLCRKILILDAITHSHNQNVKGMNQWISIFSMVLDYFSFRVSIKATKICWLCHLLAIFGYLHKKVIYFIKFVSFRFFCLVTYMDFLFLYATRKIRLFAHDWTNAHLHTTYNMHGKFSIVDLVIFSCQRNKVCSIKVFVCIQQKKVQNVHLKSFQLALSM